MSIKSIVGVIVVLAVVVVGVWLYSNHQSSSTQVTTTGTPYGKTGSQTTNTQPTSASGNTSVSSTNNSDTALNQDLSGIDAQISGLSSDTAVADKGLSNPNQ